MVSKSACYDVDAIAQNARVGKNMSKIYTGTAFDIKTQAVADATKEKCLADLPIYDRSILKSEKQSDTRVIVYYVVKNITPIPDGASPDTYDKSFRADGRNYKVDFSKEGDVWTIEQVHIKAYADADWEDKYSKTQLMPSYPSSAYESFP